MRRRIRVYLDTIYDSLQGKGLTDEQIMDILRGQVSKLNPLPTEADLDDYFQSKGLKQ